MGIPYRFDPLGTISPLVFLDSVLVRVKANISTGVTGQVRDEKFEFKITGIRSLMTGSYINAFGWMKNCRRYVRVYARGAGTIRFYHGNALDFQTVYHLEPPEVQDFEGWLSTEGGVITARLTGDSAVRPAASISSFDEPGDMIYLGRFDSGGDAGGYFRLHYFRVVHDGVTVADIVPAKRGDTLCLYDKVRKLTIVPPSGDLEQ